MIGVTVSHYRILGKLGGGGMGVVYEAEDRNLGRKVALKFLPDARDTPDALERFKREARAASALNHPHICVVYDLGEHEGRPFIAMERMQGESLKEALARGPMPFERVVKLGLQIADGLEAAHGAGIVHRDLKPANVFVTDRGDAKILDFGLAKLTGSERQLLGSEVETAAKEIHLTSPGMTLGTVAYMSPEQARGQDVDARSDLFSLGVILYEMSTGRLPFPGNTAAEIFNAILSQKPASLSSVPPGLERVVLKCLEKDRTHRYQRASGARADLERILPDRRTGLPLKSVVAVALVAFGAVGWLWHRYSRERRALELIPEITRRVEAGELGNAVGLLREARAVLPEDPTLEKLWMESTADATIETEPPGADVSIRSYSGESDVWESLGATPVEKVRVSREERVLRIAKPGFTTVFIIDSWPIEWSLKLRPEGSVPPEMVLVPGGGTRLAHPYREAPVVQLDDFLIDRHEVTNEQYLKFVDAGAYRKRELWKEPFLRDGREVPWEEAMAVFVDSTGRPGPATWSVGTYPKGKGKHPVAGVSWYEAAAYAEFVGKSLPTAYHWTWASVNRWFPALISSGSNFRNEGTWTVGAEGTFSGFGTTDMAGNVKEWGWNEGTDGKRFILGGGFGEPSYMFVQTDAQLSWVRRANYGFRCVKLDTPVSAAAARIEPVFRDFSKEEPVSDDVFEAYRGLYAYDKTELDPRVDETKTTESWIREEVSIDAAYRDERLTVHVYLPANVSPPFQSVVYFPGIWALFQEKFDPSTRLENDNLDYLLRSGRALIYPVYKSMYERRDGFLPDGTPLADWRDHVIQWSKDLGRTLDYLEMRGDLDETRVAYLGFSLGAALAPTMLAVEERFKVAIVYAGGFWHRDELPEVHQLNFAPRVTIPVLMLNGRYDDRFPPEPSQLPLFRLLGTPEKDKKHVLFDKGHGWADLQDEIRETLDWLDKYLGPVRRN